MTEPELPQAQGCRRTLYSSERRFGSSRETPSSGDAHEPADIFGSDGAGHVGDFVRDLSGCAAGNVREPVDRIVADTDHFYRLRSLVPEAERLRSGVGTLGAYGRVLNRDSSWAL